MSLPLRSSSSASANCLLMTTSTPNGKTPSGGSACNLDATRTPPVVGHRSTAATAAMLNTSGSAGAGSGSGLFRNPGGGGPPGGFTFSKSFSVGGAGSINERSEVGRASFSGSGSGQSGQSLLTMREVRPKVYPTGVRAQLSCQSESQISLGNHI